MITSITSSRLSISDRANVPPLLLHHDEGEGAAKIHSGKRGWEEGGDMELFYVYDFCRKITSPGKGF
jgi:hypothetical protein